MRILPYYILHTIINSIKKLFKTWVAVFLVIILGFGLVGGIIGYTVGTVVEDDTVVEEVVDEEETDIPLTAEEKQEMLTFIKGITFLITLAVILFSIYGGDKSGAKIFTMPDVNFLFAAPLIPQSVLMFRTVLQMGVAIVSSLYLLFQIPNLTMNIGLSISTCFAIFIAYAFLLYFSRLASVFTYTVTATKNSLRKYIRPFVIVIFAIIIGIYAYLVFIAGNDYLTAFLKMFPKSTEYVPIFGWLGGFVVCVAEYQWYKAFIYLILLIIAAVIITSLIWKIKADFYEDAFSGAQELQEKQTAATQGETVQRKKERSEKIKRNDEFKTFGAAVFFEKTMYNRRRFAKFGSLSGTAFTYLLISFALTTCLKLVFSFESVIPIGFVLLIFVFFRNLGNPLADEMTKDWLYTVPEPPAKKLWFSLLGSLCESALDLFPAFLVAAISIPEKIFMLLMWYILWVSLDLFCSSVGLFTELALPAALVPSIKAMFAVFIRMFSIVPGLIMVIIGAATDNILFMTITVLINIVPSVILMSISPLFLNAGKK